MESGFYKGGKQDYREPLFSDIKLLYKDDMDGHSDWQQYHQDSGARPTATFRFYELNKKRLHELLSSKVLPKGNINGIETQSILTDDILSYINK